MRIPFLGENNLQKEDTLDSILDVFSKTKEKLSVFISDSKEKKEILSQEVSRISSDIEKGEKALGKLKEIVG